MSWSSGGWLLFGMGCLVLCLRSSWIYLLQSNLIFQPEALGPLRPLQWLPGERNGWAQWEGHQGVLTKGLASKQIWTGSSIWQRGRFKVTSSCSLGLFTSTPQFLVWYTVLWIFWLTSPATFHIWLCPTSFFSIFLHWKRGWEVWRRNNPSEKAEVVEEGTIQCVVSSSPQILFYICGGGWGNLWCLSSASYYSIFSDIVLGPMKMLIYQFSQQE